jgi:hypothetical protein
MVNLMRGLQLGLTAATGQGPTSRDFKSQDLFGELQGMANPLESSQYQEFAQLSPQKASVFDKAIKVKGQAGIARKKAYVEDIQAASLMASAGYPEKARQRLVNRRNDLLKIDPDADTRDTDAHIELLSSGNPEDLTTFKDEAAMLEQLAIKEGILQGPDIVKVGDGQTVWRVEGDKMVPMDMGKYKGKSKPSQKTSSYLVKNDDGTNSIAVGVFNPTTKELTTATSVIPGSNLVSNLGETPKEKRDRDSKSRAKTEAYKAAVKRADKAFDTVGLIKLESLKFDDVLRLIDDGAATGPILDKMPDFRSSAVELRNLQGRLGLDVIGQTTFGALSESELNFALGTALPTNLNSTALREWVVKKQTAQNKLGDYLTEVAQYLGNGDKTIPDWIAMRKEKQEQTKTLDGKYTIEVLE